VTPTRPAAVVVLAAGEGTRMRSALPKVLHPVGGRPLLGHAVAAAQALDPESLVVVVGHGRERVGDYLAREFPSALIAVQETQNGTGHAVECALGVLPESAGVVVVTYGDVPLLSGETLLELLDQHTASGDAVTVLTAQVADPTGYGRVLRDAGGQVSHIVEHRDADDDQRAVREVNSGIYAFDGPLLRAALGRLEAGNAQGELYLTDVVGLARRDGRSVGALVTEDAWQVEGVNDRVQLAALHAELNRRTVQRWMREGVSVVDPASTWIEQTVTLEPDTRLLPGTRLHGRTHLARGAQVGPDSTLVDTLVGEDAVVRVAWCEGAEIGPAAAVGPFTFLRPGTVLAGHTKAGAYVEIKNSRVGQGSKVPHLSYVGDADIGRETNIGAATVVVNYDGVAKHRTVVGDHVRIGSDTMLVAPVDIGDGAYTAAGSVITDDVPPGAMGVGRARQRNVEGWVERRRAGTASAEAARAARAAEAGPHGDEEQAP